MKRSKLSIEEREKILKEIEWQGGRMHEPLIFQRRRGSFPADAEKRYAKTHSEENIRKIAALGAKLLGNIHFYKGFGLEIEKEEIINTKKMAQLCRKYGLKYSIYVGGTLFVETLFLEEPNAKKWGQVDQDNKPITYGHQQLYRYYPCYNQDGFVEYMKKVLKYAIEEVKPNRIHFDNAGVGRPEPQSCHCSQCVERFRQFLREKYDDEALKRRLGFIYLEEVYPPTYDAFNLPENLETIDDPLKQEWIDFRCKSKADYYKKLYTFVKEMDPSISIVINVKGVYGRNRAFVHAIDHTRFSGACDGAVMDSGVYAHAEDGLIISEIRSFKTARSLGLSVCAPVGRGEGGKLDWAVTLAFNNFVKVPGFGYEGFEPFGLYHPKSAEELSYYDFFEENKDYYTETESAAEVALLRSFASMAYNNYNTHLSTILFEQTLIQYKIPFDIIFDRNIEDLSKYSVLVLPNQESLGDKHIDLIGDFIRKGNGVVATESTSLYDAWRRKRPEFGLSRILTSVKFGGNTIEKVKYGEGRFVYIPKMEIPLDKQGEPFWRKAWSGASLSHWKNLTSKDDLVEAVKWANSGNMQLKISAPLTVGANLLRKKDRTLLHLVNFEDKVVEDIKIVLRMSSGSKVEAVETFSPDYDCKKQLEYSENNGKIVFNIPRLEIYDLVVIK